MPVAGFNPSGDFALVCDGQETLLLDTPLNRPGGSEVTINNAARESIGLKEAETSGGRYQKGDVAFTWPMSQATPQLGGRLTDNSAAVWTIIDWTLEPELIQLYRAVARNLAITSNLDQYITINRRQIGKGLGGAAETIGWELYAANVQARVQVQTETRSEQFGRQSGVIRAKVYMQQEYTLDNSYQIVDGGNTVWEIEGYESPDSITDLFCLNVMRRL